MARQFTDEERAAMVRGGEWLRAERRRRGFEHGTDFADAVGIKSVRLSAYERGLYPIPKDIVRGIASVLGLSEVEVWRGLEIDLPREFMSDEDAIAWALRNAPEEYERWLRRLRGNPATRPVDKPNDVTRKGDPDSEASPPEEPAV